jgi:hypothetical protein
MRNTANDRHSRGPSIAKCQALGGPGRAPTRRALVRRKAKVISVAEARTLKAFCSAAQGSPTTVGLPWVRDRESARTLKRFCRTLIPNVALIELNVIFPEETSELVLERFFTMVLVLVPNVFLQDDVEINLAERLRRRASTR